MAGKLRVTLRKSTVSTTRQARGTIRALGLHRIGESVEVADGPTTRGMIRAAQHLVSVEELPAPSHDSTRKNVEQSTEETDS